MDCEIFLGAPFQITVRPVWASNPHSTRYYPRHSTRSPSGALPPPLSPVASVPSVARSVSAIAFLSADWW